MKTEQLKLGPMDNFIYIVSDEKEKACFIVDPAWDAQAIENHLKEKSLKLSFILLTHAHPDHINAVEHFLKKNEKLKVYLHKEDSFMFKIPEDRIEFIEDAGHIEFTEDKKITVLHTPGHTPGSCCFLADDNLFTGDTLFIGACGRVDLPGSDGKKMAQSLIKLSKLPDETKVYPGHSYNGTSSTIAVEREHNLYMGLALKDEETFLRAMK